MRINLRIGSLIVKRNSLEFEPLPLTQIFADSYDQKDDMVSKVSSMSKISYFKNRATSINMMQRDRKSTEFYNFLDSNPDSRSRMPPLRSVSKPLQT